MVCRLNTLFALIVIGSANAYALSNPDCGVQYIRLATMNPYYQGEEKPFLKIFPRVKYLQTEAARAPFRVTIRDGRFFDAKGLPITTPFATLSSLFNQVEARTIFVLDSEGKLYMNSFHRPGYFHHSSFLAGTDVVAAGEMNLKDGKVVGLFDRSGHYKPDDIHMLQFLKWAQGQDVEMGKISISSFEHIPRNHYEDLFRVLKDASTQQYAEYIQDLAALKECPQCLSLVGKNTALAMKEVVGSEDPEVLAKFSAYIVELQNQYPALGRKVARQFIDDLYLTRTDLSILQRKAKLDGMTTVFGTVKKMGGTEWQMQALTDSLIKFRKENLIFAQYGIKNFKKGMMAEENLAFRTQYLNYLETLSGKTEEEKNLLKLLKEK